MAKVGEGQLVNLHEVVAKVIACQVEATEEFLDEEGELQVMFTASPALLSVATKFLKDNSITCAIEEDANLGKLEAIFAGKQKKGRLTLHDLPTMEQ